MDPFLGQITIFAGNFAPRGWALCDGQLLPISQNTALFSLIGTTYGGDGRTTTALPNLQGRTPMHPGRGPGLTSRRLGQRGGVETVSLTEAQMPSHNHQLRASTDEAEEEGEKSPVNAVTGRPQNNQAIYNSNTNNNLAAMGNVLLSAGGSQSHNNLQPFLAMNFIIALVGLFPSQSHEIYTLV